jgi:hypothetical protein
MWVGYGCAIGTQCRRRRMSLRLFLACEVAVVHKLLSLSSLALHHHHHHYQRCPSGDFAVTIEEQVSFEPLDAEDIALALHSVAQSRARVTVLVGDIDNARMTMLQALGLGMVGKGWVWLGA